MTSTPTEHPHNLDAERAVLGSMVLDQTAIPVVADLLQPSDFYSMAHQKIYSTILELHSAGTPVDLMTLHNELRETDVIKDVGGLGYLISLEQHVITTANAVHHTKIVAEYSRRRLLSERLARAQELVGEGEYDAAELAEVLRDVIEGDGPTTAPAVTCREYLAMKDEFPELLSIWGDGTWKSSTLNVLSATTQIGKSLFTLQAGMCLAAGKAFLGLPTRQCKALIVQSEVADREEIDRIEAMQDCVCRDQADANAVGQNLFFRPLAADFHLWSPNGSTLAAVYLRELERLIETHQIAIVFLDPVSDILPYENPQQIGAAVRPLKQLAERHGTCFVLISHWNKASRGPRPNLDQAYSGGAKLVDAASSALNLTYLPRTPVAESHARLTFDKLRYRPPLDPIILKRPCREARWFEVDQTITTEEVDAAAEPLTGQEEVIEALCFCGPLQPMTLTREVMQRASCSSGTARTRIREAHDAGKIRRRAGRYELCQSA